MTGSYRSIALLFSALIGAVASTTGSARLWVVSNSGVDRATCGSYGEPCRTISQAIENASAGDVIVVGPGQYGDVSGSAAFGGPADERPGLMPEIFLGCVLCIDKAVTVTSFAGAAETVIQGNLTAAQYPTVVGITHDGVTFGTPGHGFTITGGVFGVGVAESCGVMQANVSVAGNVDMNDTVGFQFSGLDDERGFAQCATKTAQVQLSHNTAIGNSQFGFGVRVNLFGNRVTLWKNQAIGSGGAGFEVDPGMDNGDFGVYAGLVSVLNNVATNSYYGFYLSQTGTTQYNTAINNTAAGFWLDADAAFGKQFTVFSYNAALGNRGPGIVVVPESFYHDSGFADLSHNDLIDNDRDRTVTTLTALNPVFPITISIGAGARCGLLNTGASLLFGVNSLTGGKLHSSLDYWGSAQGPLTTGPGDTVGKTCDKNGAVTTFSPFSTSPYVFNSLQ